ncbi:MAG: cadmium-translocating P-type ATPase [Defluviitaleaceae bacterium]|nr:cadmium-translocating P-type ATPase [Defluviitaleaceae bacterium]
MTKTYILQGLNCANCAAKIEDAVKKVKGVLSASLNFTTAKLRVETDKKISNDVYKEILDIIHKHEPDVKLVEAAATEPIAAHKVSKFKIIWLSVGAIAFFVGVGFVWPFYTSHTIAVVLWTFSYLLLGHKVILRAVRNITKGKVFDENFLMSIATIGAFFIGEYAGAATVMLFYQVGEFFQELAVKKSKRNITDLMDIRPDYANLQIGSEINKVSPESVNIGDTIIVKPGERIPLDGVVIHGDAMLDTSALTGESMPRKAAVNDTVLSGCINQNGVLTIQVTQLFGRSTASKIIDLVENAASKKATIETFITKFAKWYTPVVVGLAFLIGIIPPLFLGGEWFDWIYRSIILLIIACPCALVLSVPLGFFGGIGASSKNGILVKGGNYLEALANLDIVVFDKTGTLTKGVFEVTAMYTANGFTNSELLEYTSYAESASNHPIALSILNKYGKGIDKHKVSNYNEIAGHGVRVYVEGKQVLAGNEKLMNKNAIDFILNDDFGTKVYTAVDGVYIGCIVISDEIKSDSRDTIAQLKTLGIKKTVMLTGDIANVAHAVAKEINIDEVHPGLLPQQKVEKVERLREQKQKGKALAFIGDGINDAPVLAMADVGVAMGGLGSDAAIEAADVVLMTDEPMKLVEAIKIARFTKGVVWQSIVFSLAVQVLFLVLGTMGIASIWEAIFADVGVSLLAVLNTMRILKISL